MIYQRDKVFGEPLFLWNKKCIKCITCISSCRVITYKSNPILVRIFNVYLVVNKYTWICETFTLATILMGFPGVASLSLPWFLIIYCVDIVIWNRSLIMKKQLFQLTSENHLIFKSSVGSEVWIHVSMPLEVSDVHKSSTAQSLILHWSHLTV